MKPSRQREMMSATSECTTPQAGPLSSSLGQGPACTSTIAASSTKTNKIIRQASNSLWPNTEAIDTTELVTWSTSALKYATRGTTGCNESSGTPEIVPYSLRKGTSTTMRCAKCIYCTKAKCRMTERGGAKNRKLATLSSLPRLESNESRDAMSETYLVTAESQYLST